MAFREVVAKPVEGSCTMGSGASAHAVGSVTMKVEPSPGRERTPIVQP